ncbi:MAG TPA: hypothetical protein P5545_05280 [Bacteroidota bacterium]|nr:hypothetical protein [Candidatus Kapabacteria bacterium]HRS01944.1 hypothetical protein [Bacteroidota bacterium]
MLTKVEAIKKVLEEFNGVATWEQIYNNIEKYYPSAKLSIEWKAGIRGVLYREINNNQNFKRIGLGIYALKEYKEESKPQPTQKERLHSYIEGICLEVGNFGGFLTYTPDKNQIFKGIPLSKISSIVEVPPFTYPEIVDIVKRIDVIWFNEVGYKYPQYVFEVVDAIGTLSEALNRCLQLLSFNLNFMIIGPEEHQEKFYQKIKIEPYIRYKERFDFKDYNSMIGFYEQSINLNKIRAGFLKGVKI